MAVFGEEDSELPSAYLRRHPMHDFKAGVPVQSVVLVQHFLSNRF